MLAVDRLTFKNVSGAGYEVYAYIQKPVNCVEFTMKGNCDQRVLVGTEPWIQFPPGEWEEMISKLFGEMVEAWNEKFGGGSGDSIR